MKGKKNLLARFLEKPGLLHIAAKIPNNTLIIINYHRVYANELNTVFDTGVFGPSVDEFEQQMLFLKERVNLLSEQDILQMVDKRQPLSGRNALITFDDGYRDNYQLALPVLKKYHIPAIFFIPIQSIEESMLGWWDMISYFIRHTTEREIVLNSEKFLLNTPERKEQARRKLLIYMKSVKHEQSKNLLTELSQLCKVEFPLRSVQKQELMDWEQIKEIADTENFSIGSHTVSHRVLSTINKDEELEELINSRKFLRQKLSRDINSIAYPVGGYHAFSDRTKNSAARAGYSLGFSFNTGVNYKNITDPFDIKRISPEPDLSIYKATVVFPRLFCR